VRFAAVLFAVVTATAATASAADDAVVTGVVDDALLHPLAGATVVLHDSGGATIAKMVTGADGKFSFPSVPFGDYTVEASSPGLVGDHQHLQIVSPQVADVELTLVSGEEVITITESWSVPPPPPETGSVATISRQALSELPGADDRPVTDVVATKPGFVVDALGNVYARGNHANVQYQIDGVPVPDSVGSLFAASIPVRMIQNLEIYTGGMPAEFGDRLGAVVNLTTRQATDHPEGSAQVRYGSFNTIEPGATDATKLTDKIGMFAGGSYVSSDRALDAPSVEPLHDTGSTGRVFARVDWQQCDCNRYELFATYAHNIFQVPLDPGATPLDPNNPRPPDRFGNDAPAFVPHDTNSTETEDELFAALSFTHKLDNGQLMVAPVYKLSRGVLFGDPEHALGPLSDPGAVASNVTRLAHHLGGIAVWTAKHGSHLLKAGAEVDTLIGTTEFAAFARAPAGGVDPTMTVLGRDHTDAVTSGAYVQDHISLGKLSIDAGIRVDEQHVILQGGATDDQAGVSPRLGASYGFTKDTVLHAFAGVNWQPPSPLDATNAARALGITTVGASAYDLEAETDLYSEAGLATKLSNYLSGGLTVWGRYAYDQLDDTVIGSTSLVSNYNFDRGRAGGLEGSLDMRVGPWLSGFANASYGVAQGQGIASAKFLFDATALANTGWQSLDHAQTLTANAGATVRDGRFVVSGLVAYGSGLRTGPSNNEHVPGHVRGDVSMNYTFSPHAYPIKVGIDVINVADDHYAYRIGNGFVGSSYGAPRSVFFTLSLPFAPEPHHAGE
jgi:TonB dependent receptor/Carboxypeptidase regulatory-like domain/TonB-dependent Receptor Plug Domain